MAQDTLSRQLTQQLVSDPRWLQHLRDNAGQTHTSFGRATPATQRVAEQILGRPIPNGYFVRATGVQKSDSPVKPVLLSLAAMGGLGALGAAGAFGGAAGTGGAAASAAPTATSLGEPLLTAAAGAGGGFGSKLLGGLKNLGGALTGNFGNILGGAGDLLGELAGGRAEGRYQDALLTLQENQRRQQLFDIMSRNQISLGQQRGQRAQFELDAPSTRFAQGLRGNLAANLQDFQWAPGMAGGRIQPAQGLGGARPSALGPGGRGIGQQLAQLASERLGKDTYELAEIGPPPDFLGLPQSGIGDQLLGAGGTALSFLDLINRNRRRPPESGPFSPDWSGP